MDRAGYRVAARRRMSTGAFLLVAAIPSMAFAWDSGAAEALRDGLAAFLTLCTHLAASVVGALVLLVPETCNIRRWASFAAYVALCVNLLIPTLLLLTLMQEISANDSFLLAAPVGVIALGVRLCRRLFDPMTRRDTIWKWAVILWLVPVGALMVAALIDSFQ